MWSELNDTCYALIFFPYRPPFFLLLLQELRCREEELKRAALEQKSHEEFLRQREQQLAQWEQDVFERELSLLILHLNQNQEKPNVKKRKGTFKKHKLKGKNGEISMPQGLRVLSNTVKILAHVHIDAVTISLYLFTCLGRNNSTLRPSIIIFSCAT